MDEGDAPNIWRSIDKGWCSRLEVRDGAPRNKWLVTKLSITKVSRRNAFFFMF
jgi:hypothetical protein